MRETAQSESATLLPGMSRGVHESMAASEQDVTLCILCGERERKKGRRVCGHCQMHVERAQRGPDRMRALTVYRREYKRRIRRERGCRLRSDMASAAAARRAARPKRVFTSLAIELRKLMLPSVERSRMYGRLVAYTNTTSKRWSPKAEQWRALAHAASDGTVTAESIIALLLREPECSLCGASVPLAIRSLDHVRALAEGGAHSIHNLRVACVPCNREKGGRLGASISNAQR